MVFGLDIAVAISSVVKVIGQLLIGTRSIVGSIPLSGSLRQSKDAANGASASIERA
jgi:hypothetical protein